MTLLLNRDTNPWSVGTHGKEHINIVTIYIRRVLTTLESHSLKETVKNNLSLKFTCSSNEVFWVSASHPSFILVTWVANPMRLHDSNILVGSWHEHTMHQSDVEREGHPDIGQQGPIPYPKLRNHLFINIIKRFNTHHRCDEEGNRYSIQAQFNPTLSYPVVNVSAVFEPKIVV